MAIQSSLVQRFGGAGLCLVAMVLLAQGGFAAKSDGDDTRHRSFVPDGSGQGFRMRAFSGLGPATRAWAEANGVTPSLAFSHNLARIFPPSLYAEHPEFFPLVEGQRARPAEGSVYWNPDLGRTDVAAFAADAARTYFGDHPEKPSFAVGINDGLLFGESTETLAAVRPLRWFRERPDFSNLVFGFTNRVGADLATTHPGKYIGALAYYWAEQAPDFPLQPNVVPFLTADRSQGYDPAFRLEESLLQRRWAARAGARARIPGSGFRGGDSEVQDSGSGPLREQREDRGDRSLPSRAELHGGRRLGLYDYLYGKGFLIPRIHTRLLAENLRQAHRLGFTDYYAEMNPNWGLDGPQPWLVAQLLQNPEQSPEVLLEAYYRQTFGGAAVPMRRFFERCERQWMTQAGSSYWLKHFRNESQAGVFPSAVCRELRTLLADAERMADGDAIRAASGDAVRQHEDGRAEGAAPEQSGGVTEAGALGQRWEQTTRMRVKTVSEAFGVTERFVAMQEARERLNRLSFSASPGWRDLAAAVTAFLTARRDLTEYTNRLLAALPSALAPFLWEDYLRHDPVPNALVRLRAAAELTGALDSANAAIVSVGSRELHEAWRLCTEAESSRGRMLVQDGALSGQVRPARRIAGLDYGVALPEGWLSYVEPTQYQRAELMDAGNDQSAVAPDQPSGDRAQKRGRVLRLTGNKETSVFQWNGIEAGSVDVASVQVRGHVSPSGVISLTLGWLDEQQQRVGLKTLRLPEGDWPDWVTLRLIERGPDAARWVGIGVRVQNQVGGDWAEVKGFELRSLPDDGAENGARDPILGNKR